MIYANIIILLISISQKNSFSPSEARNKLCVKVCEPLTVHFLKKDILMEILNVCNKISEDRVELVCAFSEYKIILNLECNS